MVQGVAGGVVAVPDPPVVALPGLPAVPEDSSVPMASGFSAAASVWLFVVESSTWEANQ